MRSAAYHAIDRVFVQEIQGNLQNLFTKSTNSSPSMNVYMNVFGNFGRKCIMSEDGTTSYHIVRILPSADV